MVLIQQHQTVHLSGEADPFNCLRIDTGFLDDSRQRGERSPHPIFWILLTITGSRLIQRISFGRFCCHFTFAVDEQHFDRTRTQVNTDDIFHLASTLLSLDSLIHHITLIYRKRISHPPCG